MFKRISGARDILPEEVFLWQDIEEISRRTFSLYGYKEIRPPLIEEAHLFKRSLGASSEIIQKQMFLIKNKKELYALRPEGTASIVRSYIENNLQKREGFVKFYYLGPMFRLERPQKGRLRQFHHIGVEAVGSCAADLDVEIISLAENLLKNFSISGFKIKLNSLGCPDDKLKLASILRKNLKGKIAGLCKDCKVRFKKNILRVLDCKNESCRQVIKEVDINEACLCSDCKVHFTKVKQGLDSLKINYEVTPYLVRGLDYYTRTVFEITHDALGAQDALGAGGRYDNLVKELGGPDIGAIGFAFGVERLLLVKTQDTGRKGQGLIYLITLGEKARNEGIRILDSLRRNSLACETDYESKSLKAAMRQANNLGARFVLMLGEDELTKGVITIKDMASGAQKQVKPDTLELIKELKC